MSAAVRIVFWLVMTPVAFVSAAVAITFTAHWLSGEGDELGSGDPWLMIGGLLLFPLSLLTGFLIGVCKAGFIAIEARNAIRNDD